MAEELRVVPAELEPLFETACDVDFFLAEDVGPWAAALPCALVLEPVCGLALALTTTAHTSVSARAARKQDPRIPAKSLAVNPEPSLPENRVIQKRAALKKRKSPTGPGTAIIPYRGDTVLGPIGPVQVTEVYPRRRSCHPVATFPAGGPGKPHPARSSGSTPPGRTLPHCSLVAC